MFLHLINVFQRFVNGNCKFWMMESWKLISKFEITVLDQKRTTHKNLYSPINLAAWLRDMITDNPIKKSMQSMF